MVTVVMDDKIEIERLQLGPFGINAYVLICRQTKESALVGVHGEASRIAQTLQDRQAPLTRTP